MFPLWWKYTCDVVAVEPHRAHGIEPSTTVATDLNEPTKVVTPSPSRLNQNPQKTMI